jgi:hypothetical protein
MEIKRLKLWVKVLLKYCWFTLVLVEKEHNFRDGSKIIDKNWHIRRRYWTVIIYLPIAIPIIILLDGLGGVLEFVKGYFNFGCISTGYQSEDKDSFIRRLDILNRLT